MADVRNFGAAGDGRTDDTEALQHALAAGDGILELGKGDYRISRTIELNLSRCGYGAVLGLGGTARIIMAGAGPALRVLGDHHGTAQPQSVQPHTWERERFPMIRGIEILGADAEAVGIELRRTMQAVISGVLVRNCKHGIHLVERNRNLIVSDAHLYDNAEYGLFFDECNLHQAIVHGCHISYNKRAGIRSFNGDVHNVQITGNDIEYNNHPGVDASPHGEPRGAEIWFEAPEGTISEVTLAANTIQATVQPGGANIRIHGSPRQRYNAVLIAMTGNVIGSQMRGIELKHVERAAITGNTIYDSRELSLHAAGCTAVSFAANTISWRSRDEDPPQDGVLLEDCDACTVSGLTADRLGWGTAEEGAGVTLIRCRDSAVSHCLLTDPLVRGVELQDCLRCRVSDNTIVDRRQTPRMQHAIRITGRSRDNSVRHNLLRGAVERALDIAPDSAKAAGNDEFV